MQHAYCRGMFAEIERVLYTRQQIADRVQALALEMVADLKEDLAKDGHTELDEDKIIIIPIMTGAMIFVARCDP